MCNCIKENEKRIIDKLKQDNPSKTYNEDLNGFLGTGFQNKAVSFSELGSTKIYMEFKIESSFTKVDGSQSNAKKESINIFPAYCAFCGIKF